MLYHQCVIKIQDGGKRGFKFVIILIGQCLEHFPCSVVGEARTLTKPSLEGRLELVYFSLAQLFHQTF